MIITKEAYKKIEEYMISSSELERGGYLAMNYNCVICDFVPDISRNGKSYFFPKKEILLESIERWNNDNLLFAGIIHSHPEGSSFKLSIGDKVYATEFLELNPQLKEIYLPVFFENEFYIYRASLSKDGIQISEEDLIITDDEYYEDCEVSKPDLIAYYEDGETEIKNSTGDEVDGQLRFI